MKIFLAQKKNSKSDVILIDENGTCHAGCSLPFQHIHAAQKYDLTLAYEIDEEDHVSGLF